MGAKQNAGFRLTFILRHFSSIFNIFFFMPRIETQNAYIPEGLFSIILFSKKCNILSHTKEQAKQFFICSACSLHFLYSITADFLCVLFKVFHTGLKNSDILFTVNIERYRIALSFTMRHLSEYTPIWACNSFNRTV